MAHDNPTHSAAPAEDAVGRWLRSLSLAVAWAAVVGSLALSIGLRLKACPLCLYQRALVMAAAGVLTLGWLARVVLPSAAPRPLTHALALTPALAALGVAGFHVWLEAAGRLECPAGLAGLGSAPQQSLAILVLLTALVAAAAFRELSAATRWNSPPPSGPSAGRASSTGSVSVLIGALVLGGVFAVGAIRSAPPMPPVPSQPYETPLDICRPPFPSAAGATPAEAPSS